MADSRCSCMDYKHSTYYFLAISWFVLTRRVKRLKTQVEAMSDEVGNIEYDLVLKAMKLSTWRVDVPSMTINVESDYREGKDLFIPQKGTPVEKIFKHIATEQVQAVRNAFLNLAAGREEETYQEYQMTNAAGKSIGLPCLPPLRSGI